MNRYEKMDQLKKELQELRPLDSSELKRIQEEFLIESAYNTNAIEGNTITLRETALIIKEGITISKKSMREHLEIIGYKDAFQYVVSLVEKDSILDERTIKDIHSLVLMNDRLNKGRYRDIEVRILGSEHVPSDPLYIEDDIKDFLNKYNKLLKNNHIIEAITEMHLAFESIHPFIDGNGRTGRLLINLELMKKGYLPIDIKYTDREKYYDCFEDYRKTGKSEKLLNLVLEYEKEELEKYIGIIKKKERVLEKRKNSKGVEI